MSKKMTTEEFIKKSDLVHGGIYDYSKVVYKNSLTKITIIDPDYGEFRQRPSHHLNGVGSPYRSGNKKLTTEEFIEKARKVHGNLYDYSLVKYINNNTKITIIDPDYGLFVQRPSDHLMGSGCPKRSISKIKEKLSMTTSEFIKKSNKIHNNLYDYSLVKYINAHSPVIIIDPDYGPFNQTPKSHLNGHGCSMRSGNKKLTTESFIKKSREIHGDLYNYSNVNYINWKTKIIIIDPIYGEFKQLPFKHLQGHGCLYRKSNHKFELDHIIPLSLICKKENRIQYKNNKLFNLLDSHFNKKIVLREENQKKSDIIMLFGEEVRGRHYRGDMELIRYLLKREFIINLEDHY